MINMINLKKFWHRKEVDALMEKGVRKAVSEFVSAAEAMHLPAEHVESCTRHIKAAYEEGAKTWCANLASWLDAGQSLPSEPTDSGLRLKALELAGGSIAKAKKLEEYLLGKEE